ncbi:methyl-accepting chemotaxis protein [Clostridium sp. WB02_MRS01]|uniref:methyl-accepting chemotaxis protein n=1 Tax=Clostridium sp. WB02_MRS01 TaxID=2605777 RepID=UPI0012B1FD85|nr:methyl-accepting chemotaxis protein [Clostridium sp. WB02_MRS01]MSS11345.1 methyl-accepting chemotaxis protein [Clostridium sp. WB02_MRS01]
MKNFSVAKKLSISFTLIVVLFGMLLACEITIGTRSVSNYFSGFYSGAYQVVYTTEQLNQSLNALEKYLLMMITTDDVEKAAEYEKEFNSRSAEINEKITYLQNKLTLKSNKEKLNELIQNSATGQELNQKMLDLYKSGNKEAAKKLYFSDYIAAAGSSRDLSSAINDSAKIVADQYYKNARQAEIKAYIIILIFSIFILFCVILLSLYIIRNITEPVREIERAMKKLSNGVLDVEVGYTSKDEFGELAENVRMMVAELKEYIHNIAYVTSEISSGNIEVTVDIEYKNDFAPIKKSLEQITASLNGTLLKISTASQQVAAGSAQMSAGAQALSQGATEQASSTEELAASINEVSEKIKQNADHARQASANMDETTAEIESGDAQMKKLVEAMSGIENTSSEIEKIIKTIDDIAFQTNILSLNAAVEAARAGEAGKGFAVVADEVRNLASKSAEAAKDTTELIQNTLTAIENGNDMVIKTEKHLNQIAGRAKTVNMLIKMITAASEAQASTVEQINLGINQISSVIQTNSATAEESAASSEELSAQAETLNNLVAHFKLTNGLKSSSEQKQIPMKQVEKYPVEF